MCKVFGTKRPACEVIQLSDKSVQKMNSTEQIMAKTERNSPILSGIMNGTQFAIKIKHKVADGKMPGRHYKSEIQRRIVR
ncbi:hypothetical protein C6496_08580 [Candidatus Poribacteria bacterium]|nr:MAG: hypothetical protein C6496_08580 [Candidatus Poribacteria bacterium]